MNKKNERIRKIIWSAMFAALVCVATMVIKIPSPLQGYLNLGDGLVLLSGWMLPPVYGFCAAGLGSALADLLSGYVVYAPATFLIKGAMALVACFIYRALHKKMAKIWSHGIGAVLAEIIMILGYYVFEGFLYGFGASLVNIPANGVQGLAGCILGLLLIRIFEKYKILE